MKSRLVALFAALSMALAGSLIAAQPVTASGPPDTEYANKYLTPEDEYANKYLQLADPTKLPKLDYAKAPKGIKGLKGRAPASGGVQSLTNCGSPCYFYAGGRQDQSGGAWTAQGLGANLTVIDPFLKTAGTPDDYHTLAEIAAQSSNGQNTVEAGITVDPVTFGDEDAHLFVFNWVGGVAGCYNGCGYVPAIGCNPCAGANLTSLGHVGTSKAVTIQHICNPTCAWWISYNGAWQGAFPDTDWPGSTFTQSQLHQVWGETTTFVTQPCSDMGTGVIASSANGPLISSYSLVSPVPATTPVLTTFLTPSNPDKYNVAFAGASVRSIRYGGPGWNSTGTGVGSAGSC